MTDRAIAVLIFLVAALFSFSIQGAGRWAVLALGAGILAEGLFSRARS